MTATDQSELQLTRAVDVEQHLIALLRRSVSSPNSRAAYENALRQFFGWLDGRPLSRQTVLDWRAAMEAEELAPSTVALRLTAVRQLCREARMAGILDRDACDSIVSIRGPGAAARRTGNWLTAAEAGRLILTPPAGTLRGCRDRAIIATLTGCGLRRTELARLRDREIQQREGRWCIVDLHGKGRRMRTVPMPPWTKTLIDKWKEARDQRRIELGNTAPADPLLFVSVDNKGRIRDAITAHGIYATVLHWAERAALPIAPHDLRRTFSRLALAGHADLHQIQLTLGHSSIQTTERYLGTRQDLSNAPCDVLGISLPPEPEENGLP